MYAGKRCNSKSNLTKRYKLDRVASVDNRPPPDKNFGPKQVCRVTKITRVTRVIRVTRVTRVTRVIKVTRVTRVIGDD